MKTCSKCGGDTAACQVCGYAVYQNNDDRLGDCVKFTIPEMTACYRDNHWDVIHSERGNPNSPVERVMTDTEIENDILAHDVEFVGDWTAEQIAAAGE
jgi:hypothetical protein